MTSVIDALGGTTAFTYDANGNLLTLTDARSKTTTWTYTNMDRVATRTDPLTRQESFTYDLNGNPLTWTDRKGQVTSYTHDELNRQTFVGFGTTGNPPTYASSVTTTWDAGDRTTQIVDSGAGTISRTYDLLDRLTQEVTPEGTVGYTYDAANRRATMTVAGQTAISYSYDNADRLTGITQGTASAGFAYDDANRRTSLTLPNGIVVESTYDGDSQLTALTYELAGVTIGDLAYGYDSAGRRISVGGSYARTNLPSALASVTYDDANQIATWAGTSFTYDANGNLTSDGTKTYTWNARNELTALSGGVSASFAYDGLGRRRSRAVGSTMTQFLYDGPNPVQELASGTPTANLLTGLGIDGYLTRTDAAGARHFLTDALGSTIALADGSGSVPTEYTYEPFGMVTPTGSSSGNTFGFTGREDDGTGLNYYRARYYDPRLQRFLTEDPLGFNGGDVNLHAYVGNSPTNLIDPTGQIAIIVLPAAGCVGGALGTVIGTGLSGRGKPSLREIAAGCAAGSIIGLGGWAVGPAVAPGAFGAAGGAAAGGAGGLAGGAAVAPALKFLHDTNTLSKTSLDYWSRQATDVIIKSLQPGAREGLRVKADGLIMNGNTRIRVLLDRGYPVNTLPRELYPPTGGR